MAVAADDPWRPLSDRHRARPPPTDRTDRGHGQRRLTNKLADRLRARIRATGPIGVDIFMGEANAHYYATRDPLGAAGDFTTAPEISQMFGEIVGAALADCWVRAGRPDHAIYAEIGPGRGTLAADALRVMRGAGFAGPVHLVETSPALRAAQAERITDAQHHDFIEQLPKAPLLLVANEFLDALPIRQWVGAEQRRIALDRERFIFETGAGSAIREDSPARDAACAAIGSHLAAYGGAALLIDYGHSASADGDTLQAVKAHAFADPLADPGEQDLTAHVDFERVSAVAHSVGAAVDGPVEQGEWLEMLGIGSRAAALAKAAPGRAGQIEAQRARLCDAQEMGKLFKLIGVRNHDWPILAGLAR